jgi:DNA-binding NarL/FixJ family response regulator
MIIVSIVEDDKDIRQNLALLIDGTKGFECKFNYESAEAAIEGLKEDLPDVILMDIGLPGMSGIDAIKIIKKEYPKIDIIVLTIHEKNQIVFDALCAGATGYLLKETQPAKLLDAITEVHNGGSPMSSQIARMVVGSFKLQPAPELTQRETEVLTHLTKGLSYKMIGENLFISEETVRRHIKNIYRKLEVHSKSEAVAKAIREKLV